MSIEQKETEKKPLLELAESAVKANDELDKDYFQKWQQLRGRTLNKTKPLPTNEFNLEVKKVIAARGSIPMDQWIMHVLYGKDGYYSTARAQINTGDFSTNVGEPYFVYNHMRLAFDNLQTGSRQPRFVSVASGAGDFERNFGLILNSLSRANEFPKNVQLHAVDYSEMLLAFQKKHLEIINSVRNLDATLSIENGLDVDTLDFPPLTLTWQETQNILKNINRRIEHTDNSDSIPHETIAQIEQNCRRHNIDWNRILVIKDILTNFPEFLPKLLEKVAKLEADQTKSKTSASALNLPFAPNSIDVIYSNELIDAMPPKIYLAVNNSFVKVMVGFDHTSNQFYTTNEPINTLDEKLIEFEKEALHQTGQLHPKGQPIGIVAVNARQIKFIKESVRVLKRGGVFITADYCEDRKQNKTVHSTMVRFNGGNDFHDDLIQNIHQYNEPYSDITVSMESQIVALLGTQYGLTLVSDITEGEAMQQFKNERIKSPRYSELTNKTFRILTLRKQ